MPGFRRTALGRTVVSDTLLDLFTLGYIPADVHKAAQCLGFEFDPEEDSFFYQGFRGPQPSETEKMANSQKVLDRFNLWLPTQPPVIKTYLGIIGLLDSSDQFDGLILDALATLRRRHRIQMIDSDDSMFEVCDYKAVHDDANVEAVLNEDKFGWWCRLFEQQARRIADMPTMAFDEFKSWHEAMLAQRIIDQQTARRQTRRLNDEEDPERSFRTDKQDRRVFNRSLKLFIKFFGEATAKRFLAGKNLWLLGQHFVWKLKTRPANIFRNTIDPPYAHTPFKITICDHELHPLSNACVLFENMPVLDQAVAFYLHIQDAEDELTFFNTANLSTITEAGRAHPIITASPSYSSAIAWQFRTHRSEFRDDDRGQAENGGEIPEYEYERFRRQQDPSIDDDPLPPGHPDAVDDDLDRDFDPYVYPYIPRYRDWAFDEDVRDPIPFDLDDPKGIGFSRETVEADSYRWLDTYEGTAEERQQVLNLYDRYRRQDCYERAVRSRDSLVQLLRRKLIDKLDIDPVLLQYLRFPEARAYHLPRTMDMPLLRGYLERKDPLG